MGPSQTPRPAELLPTTRRSGLGPSGVGLTSELTPPLPLAPLPAARLREAATRQDVWLGGCFAATEGGAEVWNRPRTAPGALLLGWVRWEHTQDDGLCIASVSVSPAGRTLGEGTLTVLARVLALADLPLDGSRVALAVPDVTS